MYIRTNLLETATIVYSTQSIQRDDYITEHA